MLVGLVGGNVRFDCPMAPYTTLGVGGRAEAIYEAHDPAALRRVIAYLYEEHIPYLVVGNGSNLLIKDEGLEGVVILLRGSLAGLEKEPGDAFTILAGGGLTIVELLNYCRRQGLGGVEFLAGIPGTVGGAVKMNAGAFGKEIEGRIHGIRVIDSKGNEVLKDRSKLKFSYRNLEMEKGSTIIGGRFRLDRETADTVAARIAECLKIRKQNQPLEYPSAGSVFKNPPGDYAARLIEKAGLKGKRVGGAMISEKHANFIVNTGGATAKDILALLHLAQERVGKETGIRLQPEIRVIG